MLPELALSQQKERQKLPLAVICGDCPRCGYVTLYLRPWGWECRWGHPSGLEYPQGPIPPQQD